MQWDRVAVAGEGEGPRPRQRLPRLGRAGSQPEKPRPKLPQQLLLNSSKASTSHGSLRSSGCSRAERLWGREASAEVSTAFRNLFSRGGGPRESQPHPLDRGIRGNDTSSSLGSVTCDLVSGNLESRADRVPKQHLLDTGISSTPQWL